MAIGISIRGHRFSPLMAMVSPRWWQSVLLAARLASLVRKDLIRPERCELPGDGAFRFRHLPTIEQKIADLETAAGAFEAAQVEILEERAEFILRHRHKLSKLAGQHTR
jgi:hypothetical protein